MTGNALFERPTRNEWAELARERGQKSLDDKGHPIPLLSYQSSALDLVLASEVVVVEKSRRIGFTWGLASLAVLTAAAAPQAGGMDVLYIGYNLDMAREFIDTAADWAKTFHDAMAAIDEFLFDDGDPDRQIKAFRIAFASGFEIVALSSRPRSLRGRQGLVLIDEAAFHDDFKGLLTAALALLMWGGKVVVISTHFGKDNPFNVVVEDIRAGRKPYRLIRIDFDDALADGLFERVCLKNGQVWTPEGEADYRQKIIDFYGEGADEELYCIPAEGEGSWLPATLIEARQDKTVQVLRWECAPTFVEWPLHLREAEANGWCEGGLLAALKVLPVDAPYFFGVDFGRHQDLTVVYVLTLTKTMQRQAVMAVELRRVPFEQQRQILFYLLTRLPRLGGGAMDAGGNGAYLAEVTAQKFGLRLVQQIRFSAEWYRQEMPPLKAAFEDGTISIAADRDHYDDLRLVRVIKGIASIPDARTKGSDGGKRHGDAAIALALAYSASRLPVAEISYTAVSDRPGEDDLDDDERETAGFYDRFRGATW